ncbi:Tetratricopeptide TPR_2 repeat protein [Anaeromyxobacter sp. K]|uniref:tetratricopeptide repeat protein n=1 Tax=Anaeromyxobacter sp. (strain K) TaxID=447217 RepID=UPI00017BE2D2|nr:tetratricopeptide repeat protein [Anaeromyxobacter sp. K]ACG74180.1 Tetratricopeptide TPR_2 repeat protein [Anaeromyxobacter sp. K]
MPKDDWFRRETWSREDQAEFERRLARSRPTSRAQYLRIQAVHLLQTRMPELLRAALTLLDRVVTEYPKDLQAALALTDRAKCLLALGEWPAAAEAFRAALAAETTFPSVRSDAYLSLAFEVVTRNDRVLFDEVSRVCFAHASEPRPFPVQQFRWHAVQALLADAEQNTEVARTEASAALAAAAASESGFRYHRTLGLVRCVPREIEKRLRRLAIG